MISEHLPKNCRRSITSRASAALGFRGIFVFLGIGGCVSPPPLAFSFWIFTRIPLKDRPSSLVRDCMGAAGGGRDPLPHLRPSLPPTAISPPDHYSRTIFFLKYIISFSFSFFWGGGGMLYIVPELRRHNKGWKQGNQGDEEPGGSERINQARNQ